MVAFIYLFALFRIYLLIHLLNLLTNMLIVEENKPKKYNPIILKSCHKVAATVLLVIPIAFVFSIHCLVDIENLSPSFVLFLMLWNYITLKSTLFNCSHKPRKLMVPILLNQLIIVIPLLTFPSFGTKSLIHK